MMSFRALALLALSFSSVFVQAASADLEEELENPSSSSSLDVDIQVTFPGAESLFGIKAVNGKPLDIQFDIHNGELETIALAFIGGSIWTPDSDLSAQPSRILRNITTKQYGIAIPAGETETVPYRFTSNMHPRDVRMALAAVFQKGNSMYTTSVYNGTITIAEPSSSIFDPQIIFLYLFLLGAAGGIGYFFYTVWLAPYFPAQKKRKGERVKAINMGSETADTSGPASSTGASKYAEEWIPSHHLNRPEAKRVKSGSSRPKSRQA